MKSALLTTIIALFCQAAFGAQPAVNALWVYSVTSLPDPVTDAPTRSALLQNGSASGVNMLYVSVYSSTPDAQGRYLVDESSIATFITMAHAQGMQVYAALSSDGTDWLSDGCSTANTPYARFSDIAGYNAANSARFDGIMLDVEPGTSPDFTLLLGLYQCFQQLTTSAKLNLAAAINAFWTSTVTYNGVTEAAYQQIIDLKLTFLVVMGYRNFAGTADCSGGDGILCLDEPMIAYANTVGSAASMIVGLNTDNPATSGDSADETFYSLGQSAMDSAAQSVVAQIAAAGQGFGGFSVHNYRDSYLNGQLSGWPATNPPGLLPAASCTISLSGSGANLPPTGTSNIETCPNHSGQPNCGVVPEVPLSFTVTPTAACGAWSVTSSNPEFLIASGPGIGTGSVSFTLLNNTHASPQNYSITVSSGAASATYPVTEAGSGDSEVYREVYALYEQLLGRDPDSGGFAFWTGTGDAGLGQMADDFLISPEAFNSDFAAMAAYQAATGAPPTFAQFTPAVASLRAGTQTVAGLFNSLTGSGYSAGNLYENLLNRAPGSADSSCYAVSLSQCFQTIIGYPANATPVGVPDNEFQNTGSYSTAPDHSNALYLQMLYYTILSRDPDASGFAFWLGVADSGGPGILFQGTAGYATRIQILGPGTPNQGFIGSPEFQDLFAN